MWQRRLQRVRCAIGCIWGIVCKSCAAFGELAAAVPTTESQREVWLASQFGDDANCSFNESVFIHLRGELNLPALEAAIVDLRRRHEALRGCFSNIENCSGGVDCRVLRADGNTDGFCSSCGSGGQTAR